MREGNLEAPTRHPIDWKNPEFHDQAPALKEMERVFDICHGCRRCVSLCQSFPTLFELVDATEDGEVHGIKKEAYWNVVDQCFLCDLCYMTKCPYTPPHPWQLDPDVQARAAADVPSLRRYAGGESGHVRPLRILHRAPQRRPVEAQGMAQAGTPAIALQHPLTPVRMAYGLA